ncbi:McrB family protein [Poseidonibacter ostreae]|uniref:AAA domain-containing protein n=1 Tax=Poseidonibacter ostreae TaxID=2654171 RepID=A0A6L4WNC4_9BACT|nr:AAA family ATPase [Poseidonibacter ostreae]KAB7881942.1 AAA domain-containing protein [Poseidonibacter ostreae]KAB7884365.1 AAA domain-containing protein [Poseidonibacter ostreae]KAB7886603.1 AAA domain-containing protein [Poseidonibacter ostreae]
MSGIEYKITDYKSAFNCFVERFLKDRKSIFRLNDNDIILTTESINYLMDNFVNNGYTGDVSFEEKVKHQLENKSSDTNILKNVMEVLVTVIWLWRIPPFNAKNRGKYIEDLLKSLEYENEILIDIDNPFFNEFVGFASTGTYYNTNKPMEIAYIIKFLKGYLEEKDKEAIEILKSDNFNGKMQFTTTKDYSYQDKKSKTNAQLSNKPDTSHDKPRTVSIHNALLHLFDSLNYEPILSNDHKGKIEKAFSKIFNIDEKDIDMALKEIKEKLKNLDLENTRQDLHFFYSDNIKNIWSGGLDFESKNMILHGAPGTGKTYMTEETIISRKLIEKNSEYELVQFHPSYGYEDFIEGIKPTGIEKGQMKFELKNGVFKQMCIDAFAELKKGNDYEQYSPKTFYFIADEINRAELSRVFGELLLCLEDDKRLKFVNGKLQGTKVKTPNSSLWDDTHAVIIEEDGNKYFGVPENIYFIGTMNDIDRSVDSFDMALRRRFVWKHYRCDYDVIYNQYKDNENVDAYIKVCEKLNEHIISSKGFNLSDAYELGQSYFMKLKTIKQTELNRVWLEHISPILKEYLRAEYSDKEIQNHLDKSKEIFTLPKVKNNDTNS